MKKITVFAFAVLMGTAMLFAQTKSLHKSPVLTEASPESVGISAERLARIDKMCEVEVANGNVPGIVSLVARNGKIVHWKAYGMAENQTGRKMERDAIFRIASQSKAITSTAVMMLWEEGKFKLDDPISKYIPEFKNQQVLKSFQYSDTTWTGEPVKNEITIRNLLSHTSGIGYGIIDGDERFKMIYAKAGVTDLFTTEKITIAESVKKLAKLPLHHNPGESFTYSEGLDVLGYFIEVVSGMPFDEFLKTHIFDPLGMNDTRFYFPDEKAKRLVAVQQKVNGNWEKYPVTFYDTDYPVKGAKSFFSGGAGLSSTAKDYATFLQMYLNGGEYNGVRILSRTTVDIILSNQLGDIRGDKSDSQFGLAFGLLTQLGQNKGGNGSAGTFDWGGYFNTQYFADPVENVIGIIMKQTQGPVNDQTGWKFRQMVFQTIDD
ncbi:MAG TPA: serine hydrolase domain-containing protein [Draconibacterium sp.]|nr:serine hydrolase domain-containing protein [Draconibacterium sp.]